MVNHNGVVMQFKEILQLHNIPFLEHGGHHHTTAGFIQLDCPFCSPSSKKWRMGFSITGRYISCWTCGYHSLIDTIHKLTQMPLRECYLMVGNLPDEQKLKRQPLRGRLKKPQGVKPLEIAHWEYLTNRDLDPIELIELWDIAGTGQQMWYPWRIYIPIYFRGETVSWTSRTISKRATTRYLSAPAQWEVYPHKELLYGEDYCRHVCIVTEGCIDAWKIGPGATATCGTGYSLAQRLRISKYPIRVICFDSDPMAQFRAKRLCRGLTIYPGKTYNIQLTSKDAGEASKEEIKAIREEFLD